MCCTQTVQCSSHGLPSGVVEFNSSIMNDEYSGSCGVTGCETNHITLQYFYGTHFTFSVSALEYILCLSVCNSGVCVCVGNKWI